MNFLVVVIIFLTITDLILSTVKSNKNKIHLLVKLVNIALIVDFYINNKYLWQLYLLIVVTFYLTIVYAIKFYNSSILKHFIHKALLVLSYLSIVISCIALFLFPLPILPFPSGQYHVGTNEFTLSPNLCPDHINSYKNHRVKVKIWYPAEAGLLHSNYAITKDELIRILKFNERTSNEYLNFAYLYVNNMKSNSYFGTKIAGGGGGTQLFYTTVQLFR